MIAFFAPGPRRNLRNDLLVAADSITNTVSSLVKELHSGSHKQKRTPFVVVLRAKLLNMDKKLDF